MRPFEGTLLAIEEIILFLMTARERERKRERSERESFIERSGIISSQAKQN